MTMTRYTTWKIATIAACLWASPAVEGFSPPSGKGDISTTTGTSSSELNTMSFNENNQQGENVLEALDLPGNFGFDPLHLAQSRQQLLTYRKAEIKHSRLAILAVVAIMWTDLHVVDNLGATPFFEGRAFPEFVGAAVGLPFALELYGEQVEKDHQEDSAYFPGNLDLDPFHLYPAETQGQRRVQFGEIMAGRVCMLAAAGRISQDVLESLGFDAGESGSLLSWLIPSMQSTAEVIDEVVAVV